MEESSRAFRLNFIGAVESELRHVNSLIGSCHLPHRVTSTTSYHCLQTSGGRVCTALKYRETNGLVLGLLVLGVGYIYPCHAARELLPTIEGSEGPEPSSLSSSSQVPTRPPASGALLLARPTYRKERGEERERERERE